MAELDVTGEFKFTEQDFNFLSSLVYDKVGIVLAENKRQMVYSRLARRLRVLGMNRFSDYCSFIERSDDELGNLINAITTNLTSFFRESHHFDHLKANVLANIVKNSQRRVRIWSAGCSSGQEPYSIAMTMAASMANIANYDAKVLATDIDTNMLRTGEGATYPSDEIAKIPAEYQKKYLNNNTFVPAIRGLISFKQLNLIEGYPMKGPFDAIFCRNVVIYFDKPTQKQIFSRMVTLLKPHGFLYVGHSENLHGITNNFKLVGKTIYQKIG